MLLQQVPVFKVDDEKSVIGALKKEKLDAFVGLLDAAIVREDLVNENATVTVLAPTDEVRMLCGSLAAALLLRACMHACMHAHEW